MNTSGRKRSRRKFLYDLGLTTLSLPAMGALSYCGVKTNQQNKTGTDMATENSDASKLGVALVGLGNYAGGQLAPALQETEHCYLAGIVTGTPSKVQEWSSRYNIKESNVYSYDTFDTIADNKDIDIIYVVLPNSMHAEYVVRAAKAGKHVICEKPMAITVEDCDRMIKACEEANVKLSIGYRLHFEPYNLEMARLAREKVFGDLETVDAGFGFHAAAGQWRLDREYAGGGPLMDLGIYCIQSACYVTGAVPLTVLAKEGPKTDPERFKTVEQSISWTFEMPNNVVAKGQCSYEEGMNYLRAVAQDGTFELSPAFTYGPIRGRTSKGEMSFPQVNQQARQMDDFALAIKNNRPTPVPGEMGRRDVKIIQAIYESARTGNKVSL